MYFQKKFPEIRQLFFFFSGKDMFFTLLYFRKDLKTNCVHIFSASNKRRISVETVSFYLYYMLGIYIYCFFLYFNFYHLINMTNDKYKTD